MLSNEVSSTISESLAWLKLELNPDLLIPSRTHVLLFCLFIFKIKSFTHLQVDLYREFKKVASPAQNEVEINGNEGVVIYHPPLEF